MLCTVSVFTDVLACMGSQDSVPLEESVCNYTLCFLTSLSSKNSTSQMVFHPIRPQHSARAPLCNSGSRLMGQIPQFCKKKRDILVSWLLIAGRFFRVFILAIRTGAFGLSCPHLGSQGLYVFPATSVYEK